MKTNIVKTAAICIILLGIIGMTTINVYAQGDGSACPSFPWTGKSSSDKVVVLEQTVGTAITYSLKSSVVPATTTTIPGFKALCIMPDGKFKGDEGDISAIAPDWEDQIKDDFIAFSAKGGNGKNLPFDNIAHEAGEVDYAGHGGLPEKQEFLVHVISKEICGGTDDNPETCFVKPSKPNNPVPELNPVILVSVGLLGLGLVARKYKR
jgi:hypothetical protein